MNLKSNVNFPKLNAKESISRAKNYFENVKSKKKTKTMKIEQIFEKDHHLGKLPIFYEENKKKQLQDKENAFIKELLMKEKSKKTELISESEKQELLNQLNKRWREINEIYQRTTHRKTYNSDNKRKRLFK